MKIFKKPLPFQEYCLHLKKKGTIGFVPTMGCLHEGHVSLIKQSSKKCNYTIVSIFVNPLQFGPKEDFSRYPRPRKLDLDLCRKEKVEAVFLPDEKTFYPEDFSLLIEETMLSTTHCGALRPGHFSGVVTVVSKLLNLSLPDFIFMGQKDYQQCLVIKRLLRDLNFPVKIIICPTLRENDGLAKSSRNIYLSEDERKKACGIYKALSLILKKYKTSSKKFTPADWKKLNSILTGELEKIPDFKIQYADLVDGESLKDISLHSKKIIALVAGMLGKTRLIDNLLIK